MIDAYVPSLFEETVLHWILLVTLLNSLYVL